MTTTSEQIKAARAMLRWDQKRLAETSRVSLPSVKRLEARPGPLAAQPRTVAALVGALEHAGIRFLDAGDEGGAGAGPGVRLAHGGAPDEGLRPDELSAANDG